MKIAFCFIIKNQINKEHIWHNFFNDSKLDYQIIIHSKNKHKLEFLHNYSIVYENMIPNEWGRLLATENFFLEQSLLFGVNKTIFLSDSCVPLKNINYIFKYLDNNQHYIQYNKPWWNLKSRKNIPFDYLMGNSQWCILDKKDYDLFVNDSDRTHFEKDVFLGEEAYYSSILKKHNLLNDSRVNNFCATYANWEMSLKNNLHPYEFLTINTHNINIINNSLADPNLLFIRKIHKDCNIEDCLNTKG